MKKFLEEFKAFALKGNGPEDSVKSYYEVSIAIATGEIQLP